MFRPNLPGRNVTTRMRTRIQITGLAIAAAVGLGVPLVYGLQELRPDRQDVFEEAGSAAAHFAPQGFGLLAILCGLLGIAAILGVRVLLRSSDEAFARLEASRRLKEQDLDAALNNMSQGLCMFDGEKGWSSATPVMPASTACPPS